MNFNKCKLMDEVNARFFESFAVTLNVSYFVPEDYLMEVERYIFKNLKKAWKKIEKEDSKYQKRLQQKKRDCIKKAALAKKLKQHDLQVATNLEVSDEQ